MKKILTLTVLLCSLYLYSNAQTAITVDSTRHSQKTKHIKADKKDITSQLALNETQQKQVNAYNQESKQKQADLIKDTSLTTEQRTLQIKNIKKENKKNISSVLTPDQQSKMKELKGQHKKQVPSNPASDAQPQDSTK